MKIFGLAGWSGSGKTTLIVKLMPELVGRGFEVSTMKHAHHNFDIDEPGKDSYEHRVAGAKEVMISAANRWALMHELRGEEKPSVEELIGRMTPVDLLLVEGFKSHLHPKIEVHRPSVGKPLLQKDDKKIVAVASDEEIAGLPVPVLDINDSGTIADFIVKTCALGELGKAS
ncbi:MAG: molybdopterin-guanine dinucleotide biosynthesis protein B [Rhodospirillaceae bacterium]|nr:molybdopterin-guanine dinucleotide biosynthesis protein B [Rhodospirillaceae bacterium]